jgi:hypothetical protein
MISSLARSPPPPAHPPCRQVDRANIDVLLVGDSVAMVVHGHDTTLPITLEDMLVHCRAVARGARRAFLIGDLPFGSYETGPRDAVKVCGVVVWAWGVAVWCGGVVRDGLEWFVVAALGLLWAREEGGHQAVQHPCSLRPHMPLVAPPHCKSCCCPTASPKPTQASGVLRPSMT